MLLVNDDRGADAPLGHHLRGLPERVRWPDGEHKVGHAVSYLHANCTPWFGACEFVTDHKHP
jgi:hypothetical protein